MHTHPAHVSGFRRRALGGPPHLRGRAAAVSTAALLLVAACGVDGQNDPTEEDTPPLEQPTDTAEPDDVEAEQTEPTEEETPEDEPTSENEAEPETPEAIDVSQFSSEEQESTGFPEMLTEFPDDGDQLLLEEVRVGQHEGYDRVVFEHAGDGAPGWHADYVEEAVEPGSGFPLEIDGEAILYLSAVGLVPGNASAEEGQLEATGLSEQKGTVFTDVATTFVHHGTASYYVGLDQQRDFRVSVWEHEDGPRLIVDVLR